MKSTKHLGPVYQSLARPFGISAQDTHGESLGVAVWIQKRLGHLTFHRDVMDIYGMLRRNLVIYRRVSI